LNKLPELNLKKLHFLILILLSNILYAQNSANNSVSLSLFIGGLSIRSESFKNIYKSNTGLIFGGSLGIPISNKLTLDGSIQYYYKESSYLSAIDGGTRGNAILKQVVIFSGLQYIFFSKGIFLMSGLGGLSISLVDEERKDENGRFLYQTEGTGNFGIYGGLNFELSIGESPVSVYGNLKYLHSWNPVLEFDETYRALFYVGGIKLYFMNRW